MRFDKLFCGDVFLWENEVGMKTRKSADLEPCKVNCVWLDSGDVDQLEPDDEVEKINRNQVINDEYIQSFIVWED